MGRCCGGKNAGKPISPLRWYVGRGVFLGYHSVVQGMILSVSPFSSTVRTLGKFHRQYMRELWRQIGEREGIKVVDGDAPEAVAVPAKPAPSAVEGKPMPRAAPLTAASLSRELDRPAVSAAH